MNVTLTRAFKNIYDAFDILREQIRQLWQSGLKKPKDAISFQNFLYNFNNITAICENIFLNISHRLLPDFFQVSYMIIYKLLSLTSSKILILRYQLNAISNVSKYHLLE